VSDDELNPADFTADLTPGVLRQDNRMFTPGSTRARSEITKKRKERFIELVLEGCTIGEAVDLARSGQVMASPTYDGSVASFMHHYFKMELAWFHLAYYNEIESTPLGNILLALWPPAHGKTTSYENWATRQISLDAEWRGTIASENLTIAQKILQRIKSRFEPDGPFPTLVRDFGPFRPQVGATSMAQPWGSTYFNVFRKSSHDERDYNLLALGRGSSIVSTRTDHLHIDDVQSTKTLGQTDAIEEWLRQDALSRPGEHGITTIAGTRVGEDDVYSRLLDDDELTGILKVVKFKAIITDIETGEQRPLWPERYTMDQLERIRKKAGQESFDRNYMQAPGISNHNATFTSEMIDPCKNPLLSLHQPVPSNAIVYVSLDPAIGGVNCVMACEITRDGKMIVRRIREQSNLRTNEQIMEELNAVIGSVTLTGARVTDVIIEAMNFQRGLARDERLLDMQKHYGFALREHLTGINKYDENIGVPSMCGSFLRGEIVLPWADDELTRQLRAWKPLKRGSKLRQDRVMALWFAWIVWQQRAKTDLGTDAASWTVKGVPWKGTKTSLIMPVGVRT
jgi:hypothetical protein